MQNYKFPLSTGESERERTKGRFDVRTRAADRLFRDGMSAHYRG